MNILYLHGLGSSANSNTFKQLQKIFPSHRWFAVDVYPNLTKSLKIIEDFIRNNEIDVLMGTSMGGFQTLAASFDGFKVAINPPLHKDFTLVLGKDIRYFIPRTDPNETTFDFTEADADELIGFDLSETVHAKTFIVCSERDELLGDMSGYAENLMLPYMEDGKEHVIRTNCMGHRISQQFIENELRRVLDPVMDLAHRRSSYL